MSATVTLWLARRFSATHQIRILGAIEPVHGHDFRCEVEVETDGRDERDAAMLLPALDAVLARIERTHLEEVERTEGGLPSAERIAAHLHGALRRELEPDPALRVARVTVHEAVGCSATYGDSDR